MLIIKKPIQKLAGMFGYEIIRAPKFNIFSKDMGDEFLEIFEKCKFYTMTSKERMYASCQATKYIVNSKIPGDFVECGVWKGGSSMLMALTLLECKNISL